jgi:hypothetical protein
LQPDCALDAIYHYVLDHIGLAQDDQTLRDTLLTQKPTPLDRLSLFQGTQFQLLRRRLWNSAVSDEALMGLVQIFDDVLTKAEKDLWEDIASHISIVYEALHSNGEWFCGHNTNLGAALRLNNARRALIQVMINARGQMTSSRLERVSQLMMDHVRATVSSSALKRKANDDSPPDEVWFLSLSGSMINRFQVIENSPVAAQGEVRRTKRPRGQVQPVSQKPHVYCFHNSGTSNVATTGGPRYKTSDASTEDERLGA